MSAGFRADVSDGHGRTAGRGRLSKKKLIPDAGQYGLLQVRVSSSWDPPRRHGDGTDNFPRPVHREVIVEDRAAGRLAVRLHQVFQLLSNLHLHQVSSRRSRVDLDDREPTDGLKAGFQPLREPDGVSTPRLDQGRRPFSAESRSCARADSPTRCRSTCQPRRPSCSRRPRSRCWEPPEGSPRRASVRRSESREVRGIDHPRNSLPVPAPPQPVPPLKLPQPRFASFPWSKASS